MSNKDAYFGLYRVIADYQGDQNRCSCYDEAPE